MSDFKPGVMLVYSSFTRSGEKVEFYYCRNISQKNFKEMEKNPLADSLKGQKLYI